jgi:hypothetical protein
MIRQQTFHVCCDKFEELNEKNCKQRETYVNPKELRDDMTNDQKVEFSLLHEKVERLNEKGRKQYHGKRKTYDNLKKLGDDTTYDQKVEFSCLHDKVEGCIEKKT